MEKSVHFDPSNPRRMSYTSSKTSLGASKSRSRSRSPLSRKSNRSKTPPLPPRSGRISRSNYSSLNKTPPRPPRSGRTSPSNYSNRNRTPPKLPPRTHIPRSLRPQSNRFKYASTNRASPIRSILKTRYNLNMRPQGSPRFANSRFANSSTSLKQSTRFLYPPKRRLNGSSTSKPPSEFNLWSQSKFRNKPWMSNPNLSQRVSPWPMNSPNYNSTPFQQPFPHPAYLPPGGYPMSSQPFMGQPGQQPPAIAYAAAPLPRYYPPSSPLTSYLRNPSSPPPQPVNPKTSTRNSSSRVSFNVPDKDNPDKDDPAKDDPAKDDPDKDDPDKDDPDKEAPTCEGDEGEGESEGNPCYRVAKKGCPKENISYKKWKELYHDSRDSAYLTTNTYTSSLLPFGKPYEGYKKAVRTCSARCIKWDHMEFRFPGDTCCTCVCRRRQR